MKLTDQEKRERKRAYDKNYRDEHKEESRAYQKVWYEENKEKNNADSRAWYVANKEQAKATAKAWQLANKEQAKATSKAWNLANKEKIKAYCRAWYEANPGKAAAHTVKRRAAKLHRTVSWSNKKLIRQIYKQAKELTIETGESYHVDHIIPLQGKFVSGLHVETNLQILLAHDNISKSNKFQP